MHKQYVFIVLTLFGHMFNYACDNNSPLPMTRYILDDAGNPQPALLELLQELDIPHDGTLATIVPIT